MQRSPALPRNRFRRLGSEPQLTGPGVREHVEIVAQTSSSNSPRSLRCCATRRPTSPPAPTSPRHPGARSGPRTRVDQRPDPQSGQRPRTLPDRAGCTQTRLPHPDEPGSHRRLAETLVQPVEGRAERLRDHPSTATCPPAAGSSPRSPMATERQTSLAGDRYPQLRGRDRTGPHRRGRLDEGGVAFERLDHVTNSKSLVPPAGFEPATPGLGVRRSIP
jgi:hypothetical protein